MRSRLIEPIIEVLFLFRRGKQILYEVRWKGLDDPKQPPGRRGPEISLRVMRNTYEPLTKLRLLGVEKMCHSARVFSMFFLYEKP